MWFDRVQSTFCGPMRFTELPLEDHLRTLEHHGTYLSGADFDANCMGCLAGRWDVLLPCDRHGFCNACLRSLDVEWRRTCTARVPRCPVCRVDFEDFQSRIRPPAATGRALALDGGGVRGVVQLRILGQLEEEIGLDLPIQDFFDLVIGTSVGKPPRAANWRNARCGATRLEFTVFRPVYLTESRWNHCSRPLRGLEHSRLSRTTRVPLPCRLCTRQLIRPQAIGPH